MPDTPTTESWPAGRFLGELGGFEILVRSQPGFPDWDQVTPAMALVADSVTIPNGGQALFWGAGHAAIVAAMLLAAPDATATVMITNIVARDVTEATVTRNQVADRVTVLNYPRATPDPKSFDLVVVLAGQDRDLNRRWILEGLIDLRDGGRIVICGPNSGGIRTMIGDASNILGPARQEISQRKQRLAVYQPTETRPEAPAWAHEPGVAPGTWVPLAVTLAGERADLVTLPGIFSSNGLDAGTSLLLDNLPDLTGKRVLDLGGGSGVIGIAAARRGAASVTMTDVNLLAVAAARENIARTGVEHTTAVASDLYRAIHDQRFDVILCNPPFHAGQRVDRDIADAIVREAPTVLADGGEIVLVANRFLPYDRALRATFGDSERVAETERYHVLHARLVTAPETTDEPAAESGDAVVVTEEMRERFPFIDDPDRPKQKPQTRRRSSRSIRRGPHRRRQ